MSCSSTLKLCCVDLKHLVSMVTRLISTVLSVLKAEQISVSRLKNLTPFLNHEVVCRVLQSLPQINADARVSFRFFIWTSSKARCKSELVHKIMVDMLMEDRNQNPFDVYWRVLDEFNDNKFAVSADAFLVLILGYWRLKKVDKVVETFGRMKDYVCEPNIDIYNVLLNVLVKSNLTSLALAVYNLMLKSNTQLNTRTYDILLDGLFKDARTEDALTLFMEMAARGVPPGVLTYTVLISGLCKANRPDEAHKFFKIMLSNGCTPDCATFRALLDGFCKSGQIDKAFKIIKTMKEYGYSVGLRGHSSVLYGLFKAKRLNEAEEYFTKGIESGLEPDVILYTVMMRGLCNAGKLRDATKMFRDMMEKGIQPDTQCYNTLIKGLCDKGFLDEAKSLKLEISQHEGFPNTCTYTILICAFCRNGLLDNAQKLFEDMEKFGCSPSAVTFNALIDGLCKSGELEKAKLTFCKMGAVPPVYLRLCQGSKPVDSIAGVHNWVEQMISSGSIHTAYEILTKISSVAVPNTNTYNILMNGMCKAGLVNYAVNIFNNLPHTNCLPDSVTYATLINGLLMNNREGEAYKHFEQMIDSECKSKPDAYIAFMTWASRKKNLSDVLYFWLRYLKALPRCEDESVKLIEKCFRKGDIETTFRSLLELSAKLFVLDSAICNIFLICLCEKRMIKDALKAFYILEEFKVSVSAPGCVMLIYALRSRRKLEDAVKVFLYSMQEGYKLMPRACNCLINPLLHSDSKRTMALELVDKMASAGYDLDSCFSVETKTLLSNTLKVVYGRKSYNLSSVTV